MGHLVAEFPGARLAALLLHDAILWTAKEIESALEEQVESERKPGKAIGQNAVVDVAAGGVVAGERRGLFPGFAAAAGVLVIAVGQRLAADEPKSLEEKGCQECGRDPLREIEAKAAKHAKAMGHYVQSNLTSLNGALGPSRATQPNLTGLELCGAKYAENKKAAPKGGFLCELVDLVSLS